MLFCILRFINGLFLSMISGGMLILIFSRIEKPRAQTVGLSILYSAVLANAVLVGMLVAELCSTVSWKEVYYYLISALLLSLALVLAIIRKDSGHERPQLGKIDLPGMLFFAIFCGCTAYILLFGEKQDWFSDRRILKATFIGLIAILLFVLRERTAEVPLLDLSIFRLGDFLLALILLALYYGLKDSINLLYAYATGPLGWPRERVMLLGLCNVVPLCLSMWATCILMLRKLVGLGFFFIGGFALLSLYHIYTYECLAPDLSFLNLAISFALQGASSGMLFVPIVLLGLSKIPPSSLVTGIVAGAYTRFLVSLAVIALSFALQSHLLGESRAALGTPLSQENTSAWQPPDQTTLPQRVYLQQQFMANKAFFSIFAMSSVAILVVLILIFTLNWIRKRYRYSR